MCGWASKSIVYAPLAQWLVRRPYKPVTIVRLYDGVPYAALVELADTPALGAGTKV